ncbi:MAG: hypothetical protein ACMXYK_04695 [Candidatus Woesearchaeota archaeon]
MSWFYESMDYLIAWGLFDVILPFVLIYTIVFGLLQKINLLGQKNYNAMFSFTLSFFAIYNITITQNLPTLIARFTILLLILICILIIAGFFNLETKYASTLTTILILLYVVYIVLDTFGLMLSFSINQTLIFTTVTLIIFFGLIRFILGNDKGISEGKPKKESKQEKKKESKPKNTKQTIEPQRPQDTTRPQLRENPSPDDYEVNTESYDLDDIRKRFGRQ